MPKIDSMNFIKTARGKKVMHGKGENYEHIEDRNNSRSCKYFTVVKSAISFDLHHRHIHTKRQAPGIVLFFV